MNHFKRLFSVLLSVVLVASLCSIGVYAGAANNDEQRDFVDEVQDAPAQDRISIPVDEMAPVPTEDATFDDGYIDALATDDDAAAEDEMLSDDEALANDESGSSDSLKEEQSDNAETSALEDAASSDASADDSGVVTLPKEALGFVYVDEPTVVVGESQSVVVGFADENLVMESAVLHVVKQATGETVDVTASVIDGSAALFSMDFASDSDADRYYLSSVEYISAGQTALLDLGRASLEAVDVVEDEGLAEMDSEVEVSSVESEETAPADSEKAVYGFEVISPEVVNAVGEAMDDIDGDAVLAFDGSDEVVVTDSVDDAMAVVDEAIEFETSDDAKESADGVAFDLGEMLGVEKAYASVNGNLVVAIDPGHGGKDSGAVGNGLYEKNLTLSIGQHMYNELRTYSKVIPYMTRTNDTYVGLKERVQKAVAAQADVFVSIHINSAVAGARGAEVWVPNNSSYYKSETADKGRALGAKILKQLTNLGLKDRGVKTRNSESGNKYPDGSIADYYTVINECRLNKIPAIIVEHAFISDAGDAIAYLHSDTARKKLGIADATGVAQQYGLKKGASTEAPSDMRSKNNVVYQAHVQNIGWQNAVRNGVLAGTMGRSLRVEAFKVSLDNPEYSGGIQVRSHVQNVGWQGWVNSGKISGTSGRSLRVEAVQIKLTGEMAEHYDVLYRAHVQNIGWQGWVKNGASAGTTGKSLRIEAVEIKLQKKSGSSIPTPGTGSSGSANSALSGKYVTYQSHVQNIGWQKSVADGATAGTSGKSLRMESVKLNLGAATGYSGGIRYRSHIQNVGWESGWKYNGAMSGTSGKSLRLEAIQIELTGDVAKHYDVYYRVHAQNYGWLGWAKNGDSAGTEGYSLRLEAIQVKLVKKNAPAPGYTTNKFKLKGSGIMGNSQVSANQMVRYFKATKKVYPEIYAQKGAKNIEEFVNILCQEARAEGVRADIVFCQAMKETGWLQYGGDVKAEQCNFCGMGATGGGVGGATFADVRQGLRAQIQHLKAYASKAALKNPCVDPRFNFVTRGVSPTLPDLNGHWAVPGTNYGQEIFSMITACKKY